MDNDISRLPVIGRRETVHLPEWNLHGLTAKVDTGAFTSSIHCSGVTLVEEEGKTYLEFRLLDPEHPHYQDRPFRAGKYVLKSVRSSNGGIEQRYVIDSRIGIGGHIYKCKFTLADRSKMRYPVLIGRKFIKRKFLVDVSGTNLLSSMADS